MFLTCCSPMSSKAKSSLSRTWSRTTRLTQIPPGSAKASSRAATFTPSPKMSRPSMMMSPRLIPIRNSMRRSRHTALRSAISRCTSTAQRTASTTLANSTSSPSPVVLTMRPRCSLIFGSASSRAAPSARKGAFLIRPHQPRIASDIGGENGGELAFETRSVAKAALPNRAGRIDYRLSGAVYS